MPVVGGHGAEWVACAENLEDDVLAVREVHLLQDDHVLRGDAADRAVSEALDWTGLATRARDPVRTLSGGMQRGVNIAAGTLHSPDLVLLDVHLPENFILDPCVVA